MLYTALLYVIKKATKNSSQLKMPRLLYQLHHLGLSIITPASFFYVTNTVYICDTIINFVVYQLLIYQNALQ